MQNDQRWRSAIEGCPLGSEEAAVRLSDPPYFTLYPNPDLARLLVDWQKADKKREFSVARPHAFDVSVGKDDPLYKALNYHTKVPPRAILRYILYYTRPGDVILDPFAGSGMTGVAASLAEGSDVAERARIESEIPGCEWGTRNAVLIDLGPAATYMARAFNKPFSSSRLRTELERIAHELERDCSWLYKTRHTGSGRTLSGDTIRGDIDYVVWSDVYLCSVCQAEVVYWEAAVDPVTKEANSDFKCLSCDADLSTRSSSRALTTVYDTELGVTIEVAKQVPVCIYYRLAGESGKREKAPDEEDLALLKKIAETKVPSRVPIFELPEGVNTRQPRESHGIHYVHQFYTKRNLWVLSFLEDSIARAPVDVQHILRSLTFALHARASKRNRHIPKYGHRHVGVLSGTLYIPPLSEEANLIASLAWRGNRVAGAFIQHDRRNVVISTQSATDLRQVPDCSVDYIFTDPPFGGNIMYSELNALWEAWLGVRTNNTQEAIENEVQGKSSEDYADLMMKSFQEMRRVLKPGRWITVEFHNSHNKIWNAIQESMMRAGFVIADVRMLDKVKGTIKQLSSANAAKQDLVITAYKPLAEVEAEFKLRVGTQDAVWIHVADRLARAPMPELVGEAIEPNPERKKYRLFEQMVAYHIQQGAIVPIDAPEFYAGLDQRYRERDGMYFLPEQAVEYDALRRSSKKLTQTSITVFDEASAIQWLRDELAVPSSFQDLVTRFMSVAGRGWAKYESTRDLKELLEENFVLGDDGLWRLPDHAALSDLEHTRQGSLLREFNALRAKKTRITQVRTEAVKLGFRKLFDAGEYKEIVAFANRIPRAVVDEDVAIMMFVDLARSRTDEG